MWSRQPLPHYGKVTNIITRTGEEHWHTDMDRDRDRDPLLHMLWTFHPSCYLSLIYFVNSHTSILPFPSYLGLFYISTLSSHLLPIFSTCFGHRRIQLSPSAQPHHQRDGLVVVWISACQTMEKMVETIWVSGD